MLQSLLHKAVQEGEADVYPQVLTGRIWRQSCLPCLHSSTAVNTCTHGQCAINVQHRHKLLTFKLNTLQSLLWYKQVFNFW